MRVGLEQQDDPRRYNNRDPSVDALEYPCA